MNNFPSVWSDNKLRFGRHLKPTKKFHCTISLCLQAPVLVSCSTSASDLALKLVLLQEYKIFFQTISVITMTDTTHRQPK
jgi:hypothetical protein